VGGAAGTACREALTLVIPTLGDVHISIVAINVVGAFLLGLLGEALTRPGIDPATRVDATLLLGTGFCGGFTTYSTLATDTAVLNSNGHLTEAVVYATATLVIGGLATFAGMVLGARVAEHQVAGSA
jgi:CrcB protein